MQQLLVDGLTGDRVILAPARALRPDTFRVQSDPLPANVPSCPFCAGNELETPPEVARCGPGAHEVVIFSPAHDADIGVLSDTGAGDVLVALRDRAHFHVGNGLVYPQAF